MMLIFLEEMKQGLSQVVFYTFGKIVTFKVFVHHKENFLDLHVNVNSVEVRSLIRDSLKKDERIVNSENEIIIRVKN